MSELGKLLELPWLPIGTFFNVICIFIGGVVGIRLSRQLTDSTQRRIRKFLAVLTVLAGGYMICNGLYGGWHAAGGGWRLEISVTWAHHDACHFFWQPLWHLAEVAGAAR